MMSLEPAASNNASPDKNASSGLQVVVIDGGDDGGSDQFATQAILKPKKVAKQPVGKTQAVIVAGKTVKPPKIGTMVDIEIQSKDGPMQWYTGRITAMVQTTEDSSKSVYKVGFVDTEKLCFNLVDHFLAREYPALYPIPNWAPGGTKTTQPDDNPARTGTRGQRKKRGAETSTKRTVGNKKKKKSDKKKKAASDGSSNGESDADEEV